MNYTPGVILVDTSRSKVGTVKQVTGDRLTLSRPSGLEWEVGTADVRKASPNEELSVKVHERNIESARGWGR